MDFESLKPGRELDALVAEKVMGWKRSLTGFWFPPDLHPNANIIGHEIPHYSTDTGAAWEVVEKFPHFYLFRWIAGGPMPGQWECRFSDTDDGTKIVWADTAPHAICLAALKAVGK